MHGYTLGVVNKYEQNVAINDLINNDSVPSVFQLQLLLRVMQLTHFIHIGILDKIKLTPNSKAKECMSCLHREPGTDMGKEQAALTEQAFYIDRCSYRNILIRRA